MNGLLAIALGVYAATAFFRATETKREILYAAIFLTAVSWLTASAWTPAPNVLPVLPLIPRLCAVDGAEERFTATVNGCASMQSCLQRPHA